MKTAPTLRRFQKSDAKVRGIVGPVGSGKSSVCVLEIPRRAMQQEPGPDGVRRTRFAVIRNTYSQLRDTTRKTFEQWIPAGLGEFHEQSFTWRGEWFADDAKTQRVECEVLFRALDRPEDVKKLLSLELTGAYINEAREIPKHVLDVLETRISRYPAKKDGGASWSGIWFDTNPWHSGHWGAKLFAKRLPGYEVFRQPGGRGKNAENTANLDRCWDQLSRGLDGQEFVAARAEQVARLEADRHESPCRCYYKSLCVGKDKEWIRVYVDGEDAAGDVGSVWGVWISAIEAAGKVVGFDHPRDEVVTVWDLGKRDSTAIWFFRVRRERHWNVERRQMVETVGYDVLDHHEATREGLEHYFGVVDGKGYAYAHHWLPHDAESETLATEQTVLERCREHWGQGVVDLVPKIGVDDGIGAVRWLLEQDVRIHERCTVPGRLDYSGVDALREYRFEWDEANQCFSREPMHNWASHSADAFRYLAVIVKHVEAMTRRPGPAEAKPAARSLDSFTLEEIWDTAGPAGDGGRL